jgi:hypothetical protein
MQDWYVIVNGDQVFGGMSPNGRLLWDNRESLKDPIQIVLFPTEDVGKIPGLPETAEVLHLSEM